MAADDRHVEEMSRGLEILRELSVGFEVGDPDPKTKDYPLIGARRTVAWVSWEFVGDLPNTPGYKGILEKALDEIRRESRQKNRRMIFILERGVKIGG